jgi:hypothetical protein
VKFVIGWRQWVLEISDKPGDLEPEPAFKVPSVAACTNVSSAFDVSARYPPR